MTSFSPEAITSSEEEIFRFEKNLFSEGPIRRISEVNSGVPESGTRFHTLVTLLIKRPPLKKSISEKSDVPDKNPGCPD